MTSHHDNSSSSTGKRAGGCLCGGVRFEVELPSLWCAHCHCSMCRRAHGAAFVTWFGMKEERLSVTEGDALLTRFESSDHAWRAFCSRCGTTMLFGGDRWAGEVHIARACLDGELDRQPNASCYWDDRVDWGEGLDHLTKLGGESGTEPLGS